MASIKRIKPAKLSRPLDFLVVADHSDNMGFFPDLFAGKPEILAEPTGRKRYDMIQSGKGAEAGHFLFIGAVLALAAAGRRIKLPVPQWVQPVLPYAIGGVAMFWVIQGVTAL